MQNQDYIHPSFAEMEAIEHKAREMRAQVMADGWAWITAGVKAAVAKRFNLSLTPTNLDAHQA